MPTPTRIKTVVPTATPPAPPTPAAPKPPLRDRLARLLPGFNVNSVLLLIVIILLAVMVCKPAPKVKVAPPPIHASIRDAEPAKIEYQYATIHVSRSYLNVCLDVAKDRAEKETGYRVAKYFTNGHGIPDGWEYVGPLCDNGTDGAFILIRKPK